MVRLLKLAGMLALCGALGGPTPAANILPAETRDERPPGPNLRLAEARHPGGNPPTAAEKDVIDIVDEQAWRDNRWNSMDVGRFVSSSLPTPNGMIMKGLSIRLGETGDATVCYDTATATLRAGWTGGFIEFDPARFGLLNAPRMAGDLQFRSPNQPAWGKAAVDHHGFFFNGQRLVLSYSIDGMPVLDSPWAKSLGGEIVFIRALELGASEHARPMRIAELGDAPAELRRRDGNHFIVAQRGENILAIATTGSAAAALQIVGGQATIEFPSGQDARRSTLFIWRGPARAFADFAAFVAKSEPVDLEQIRRPGSRRWTDHFTTTGHVSPARDAYVIDTITVPYENSYNALMFLSGVDFFDNGDAAVCTMHGDVWVVSGIDDALESVTWRRFATGLFQPLGLRIVNNKVHVLGRDQITVLHDRNNNGEADFYENFSNQIKTSPGHEYVTSLDVDAEGNFYYVCPAGLHRVSSDGRKHETLASGWRYPNGMGVSPNGILTAAPQEGTWTPASAIFEVQPGGYYGFGGPRVTPERPLGYDPPLCWIPRRVDNSSGSQVWVTSDRFGPLQGQMLHLSFGRCSMLLVLREVVDGQAQGGVAPLRGRFLSGVMRGVFRQSDGQLYVVGANGWQTGAVRDGCFQRVRYTGATVHLPVGLNVHENGIRLSFTEPLDREFAEDVDSYSVSQWNYIYSSEYGSKEYSVRRPGVEGHDRVEVNSATVLAEGRSVFLEISGLGPVMQMQIRFDLEAEDGAPVYGEIYNTIHRLGPALEIR